MGGASVKQEEGDEIELFIYTHVRENELRLFGFDNAEQLSLFELLISVNGVGPKVALSIISQLGIKKVINCILKKDSERLKVPGVGLKTADKIILELHDKLKKKGYGIDKLSDERSKLLSKMEVKLDEASEALKSLGYSPFDIKKVLESISFTKKHVDMAIEDLVKYLLSQMK